jgi:hypothetical protein
MWSESSCITSKVQIGAQLRILLILRLISQLLVQIHRLAACLPPSEPKLLGIPNRVYIRPHPLKYPQLLTL